jgi:hypothetical protein
MHCVRSACQVDVAIVNAFNLLVKDYGAEKTQYKELHFTPFDASIRRTEVLPNGWRIFSFKV